MTKTELIEKLSGATQMPVDKVSAVVNGTFDTIKREVKKGGTVQIHGFGAFEAKERSERQGRNPQTGEAIIIAAHKVPYFRAFKEFKELVNHVDWRRGN